MSNLLKHDSCREEDQYNASQGVRTYDSQIDLLSTKTDDTRLGPCKRQVECVVIEDEMDQHGSESASENHKEVTCHSKRRKIHMDTMACFQHADTEDGKKPLTNPSMQPLHLRGNLYPFSRKRKSRSNGKIKVEEEWNDSSENPVNPYGQGCAAASQGFVSAADMYKITSNAREQKPGPQSPYGKGRGKLALAKKKNPNQSSILSFMTKTSASSV